VVTVSTEDIDGIRLASSPMATAAGRIVVDQASRASFRPSTVRIGPQSAANEDDLVIYVLDKPAREDFSFEFRTPGGLVNVRPSSVPSGWNLRAVRLNSTDVTDTGIEFRPGERIEGIEVELTNRFPQLSGRVADSNNERVMDYTVLAFSSSPNRWAWNSRYVTTARPGRDGRFEIHSLPPGDYYVVVLEYMRPGQWMDAKFLESMSRGATKVTLRETQATAIDLRWPR
jgi:hypothetical protein